MAPASFSGLMWILIAVLLTINPLSAMSIFTYVGFLTILGIAMADTAMDGFILDICDLSLVTMEFPGNESAIAKEIIISPRKETR